MDGLLPRPKWVSFLVETLFYATCKVAMVNIRKVPVLYATVEPLKAQLMKTRSHHINPHKLLLRQRCSLHCCDAIGISYC